MSINSGRFMELTNVILDTLINDERIENVLPVSRNFYKRNFPPTHTKIISKKSDDFIIIPIKASC